MSQENISSNDLQLLAIPQLMKKHFFIPDYQRGYRWGEKEVYALLKDLWNYFHSEAKGFYCLQPIVVKECSAEIIKKYNLEDISDLPPYDTGQEEKGPKNNVWYEVIDGQQRLTTIRVLIALHETYNYTRCSPYELRYATRPELKDIFSHFCIQPVDKIFEIDSFFVFQNIDVEYVRDCGRLFFDWFMDDSIIEPGKSNEIAHFLSNFYSLSTKDYSVQVIWYETKEDTDARDIFERLNNLKVPLSSSELIRALFLSSSAIYKFKPTETQKNSSNLNEIIQWDKETKQSSINAKWDEIEHFFRDKNHWSFITNKEVSEYRNRIEILFDLIAHKTDKDKDDRLFTYLFFDSRKEDLWDDLWGTVIAYYDTIRFWYENRDYYHKIGYLVHERKKEDILLELLKFANNNNNKHHSFDAKLDEEIRKTILGNNPYLKFSELAYDESGHYDKLKSLLFLYNIEYTRTLNIEERFPFDDYKKVEKESGWTLEHIHAQNSQCLNRNSRQEWEDWVTYTFDVRRRVINPSQEERSLISDLESLKRRMDADKDLARKLVQYDDVINVFQKDINLYSDGQPLTMMHQLSNLALLNGSVNSGIGKGSFSVKQQYINRCIADGEYIPVCTQRVFLKHYHAPENHDMTLHNQMLSWNDDDRKWYYSNMKSVLGHYFKEDNF